MDLLRCGFHALTVRTEMYAANALCAAGKGKEPANAEAAQPSTAPAAPAAAAEATATAPASNDGAVPSSSATEAPASDSGAAVAATAGAGIVTQAVAARGTGASGSADGTEAGVGASAPAPSGSAAAGAGVGPSNSASAVSTAIAAALPPHLAAALGPPALQQLHRQQQPGGMGATPVATAVATALPQAGSSSGIAQPPVVVLRPPVITLSGIGGGLVPAGGPGYGVGVVARPGVGSGAVQGLAHALPPHFASLASMALPSARPVATSATQVPTTAFPSQPQQLLPMHLTLPTPCIAPVQFIPVGPGATLQQPTAASPARVTTAAVATPSEQALASPAAISATAASACVPAPASAPASATADPGPLSSTAPPQPTAATTTAPSSSAAASTTAAPASIAVPATPCPYAWQLGQSTKKLRAVWEQLLEEAAKCLDPQRQPYLRNRVAELMPHCVQEGISVKYGRKVSAGAGHMMQSGARVRLPSSKCGMQGCGHEMSHTW